MPVLEVLQAERLPCNQVSNSTISSWQLTLQPPLEESAAIMFKHPSHLYRKHW